MGRQIRFYLINEDEKEFLRFIEKNGGTLIDRQGVILTIENCVQESNHQVNIRFLRSKMIKGHNNRVDVDNSDVIEYLSSANYHRTVYHMGDFGQSLSCTTK